MPYSEIVTLRQMRPAYNIKEESLNEWKSFIANDQFNDILKKVVSAIRNNDADNHKSIWIAGTYGTGKSHAGAVIQHLLCDPWDDVKDYIEEEYKKPKFNTLKSQLVSLRQTKRLFPINMYGQQSIAHEEDLSLQLQREIKKALKVAGINIIVKTDFDNYVQHIEAQPTFWEQLILQNAQLESLAPDVKKLKQKLGDSNTDVLNAVRKALLNGGYDIRLQSNNLKQWILEIQNALKEQGVYNGLLIIWDEFTELITSAIGTRLLVQLQEIAEAMMNSENDSYFLLISHPSALNSLREEEREKTKGRYHYVSYNMEPVSAFKIMSKKFKIVDEEKYEYRQHQFFSLHPELLDMFSTESNNTDETRENISYLFPLHPATANLATYYAREAGSSSRSVFEFLASDSVRDFLDYEDAYTQNLTITADYLWDYVQEYFESNSTKFGAVTERFNSHHLHVESQGDNHLKVFKGILLLNALNNIANSDTVTPSTENIGHLFAGTPIEVQLADILEWFNEKSIIQRQPNGNFSILFTALPGEEIQKIKDKLKSSTYLYTDQVIKSGDTAKTFFDKTLSQVTRPKYYDFFSLQSNEYTLMNHIENIKKNAKSYETFIAFMVGRNDKEIFALEEFARKNCQEERYQNVAFIVMDTPLGEKEYERFIEYKANAECAQTHGLPQQKDTYTKQAGELIEVWLKKMKGNNVTLFLRGENMTIAGSKLTSTINTSIAPKIFSSGPESLDIILTKNSVTFWQKAYAKKTVDVILSYDTKQDIVSKCQGQYRHVEFLLQDSVNDNLEWKDSIDPNHPLKKVCDYIDEWLSGKHTSKNQSFNLGDKLIGLTEAPYGLFNSVASMAMVAFAMRKYVNIIYDTNGKQRTAQHMVDDIVEMFTAWENNKSSNKLNFIFESKEAGKVSKSLICMFSLNKLKGYNDISSLKDARWAVLHAYCSEKGYPLWSLKYCDECTEALAEFINNLIKVVTDPESMKNPSLLNDTINGYDALKMDFGNLLLPEEDNFHKGFVAYLQRDDIVKLADEEVDEAISFLKGHLEGEVGLWREDSVKDQLKNWRISKTATVTIPSIETHQGGRAPQTGIDNIESVLGVNSLSQKRNNAIKAINDSSNLYQSIADMINHENEYIINILMKYV